MDLLYKLFRQDPNSREGIIVTTSILGIIVSVCIASIKILIGILASSIAIITEGVNNATDALSSVLTLIGTKLAGKHPDKKHPFGYGRIEYITSLAISIIILISGIEMAISSIKLIINPTELHISYISLSFVAISAVIKFFMGVYTIRKGEETKSGGLKAVGIECRNDSFISVITITSALIFLCFDYSIDAYAGAFTSTIIIKAGFNVLTNTLSEIIGRPNEPELAMQLYKEIRATEGIINAADLMLHNYGPNAWSGSANLEIDHKKTIGEVYQYIHELQLRIMHEYNVTMVFGVYAVDNDNKEMIKLRNLISNFIKTQKHILSYHALYIDKKNEKLYCDFIVDYDLKDWDKIKKEISEYLKQYYPKKTIELTIETEFV